MKTMFLSITTGLQESLWINSGLLTTDQKIVPFLYYILSVTVWYLQAVCRMHTLLNGSQDRLISFGGDLQ